MPTLSYCRLASGQNCCASAALELLNRTETKTGDKRIVFTLKHATFVYSELFLVFSSEYGSNFNILPIVRRVITVTVTLKKTKQRLGHSRFHLWK